MTSIFILAIIIAIIFYIRWKGKKKRNWEKDKVVIIGGCGAIGSALLEQLESLGVQRVFTVDIKPDADIQCDVTDAEAVVSQLKQVFEEATILINTIGLVHAKPFIQLSAKDIQDSIKVNMLAYFYTCQEFIKYSNPKDRTGQPKYIINLSSCLGLGGVANMTDYCATKFAIFGFSESLRNELAGDKQNEIKVLTVCPFLVEDSEMFKGKILIKFPWLTRPLNKANVAKRIIQAISEEKSELLLPWWVNCMGLLRLIPTGWFDRLQSWLGVNDAVLFSKKY
jgi:all-trans-retinol dehydrogenase (NAD+)